MVQDFIKLVETFQGLTANIHIFQQSHKLSGSFTMKQSHNNL